KTEITPLVDVEGLNALRPSAKGLKAQGLNAQADGLSFPIALEASDEDGSVELTGAVSLAPSLDLNIDFDITSFSFDELTMEFGADQTLLANLTGSGQVSFDESVTLGSIPFAPIILTLP